MNGHMFIIVVDSYTKWVEVVERKAVRTVKEGLRKNFNGALERRVVRWLLRYWHTPLRNGRTAGFVLLGFKPRSLLDNVVSRPLPPAGGTPRSHAPREPVCYKNYATGSSWKLAVVQTSRNACLSTVMTEDGELHARHEDQLKHRRQLKPYRRLR